MMRNDEKSCYNQNEVKGGELFIWERGTLSI